MAQGGMPAFSQGPGLPGRRSALLITTAAYADAQLAWLRPPVSGATNLAEALGAPRAGGFAVETVADATEAEIRLAVARFLAGRSRDETVLVYLACHAIRDRARLYFAATDTWLRYPQRSAVPAPAVLSELDLCGAGNRLLILDCCFSGGFAEEKGELDLTAELGLDGRGVAMLSGSRAREYSYEGLLIAPELPRSVFTEGLAVGLATGAADTDGNGIITVAEAYNYAYRYVRQNTPRQAPQYYLEDGHGDILLGRTQPLTPAHGLRPPRAATRPLTQAPVTGPFPAAPRSRPAGATPPPDAPVGPVTQPTLTQPAVPLPPPPAHAAPRPARCRPAAPGPAVRGGARDCRQQRGDPGAGPGQRLLRDVQPGRQAARLRRLGRPVRIRDAFTNGLVRELRSAGPSIYDLAFSPDGALLAAAGGTARSRSAR